MNKSKISNNAQSAKHKTDSAKKRMTQQKLTQQKTDFDSAKCAVSDKTRIVSKNVTRLGNDGPLPTVRPTPGPRARG